MCYETFVGLSTAVSVPDIKKFFKAFFTKFTLHLKKKNSRRKSIKSCLRALVGTGLFRQKHESERLTFMKN